MPAYEPRARRSVRQALVRAGVWVFLALFVVSVLGVAVVVVSH